MGRPAVGAPEQGPYSKRKACRLWVRFVTLAGGRVRGWKTTAADQEDEAAGGGGGGGGPAKAAGGEAAAGGEDAASGDEGSDPGPESPAAGRRSSPSPLPEAGEGDNDTIWPLELVDRRDPEQMGSLYKLLSKLPRPGPCQTHGMLVTCASPVGCLAAVLQVSVDFKSTIFMPYFIPYMPYFIPATFCCGTRPVFRPHVWVGRCRIPGPCRHLIVYYLHEFAFPETMQHAGMQLSASGQDLGGDILFPLRFGFSGTPNDNLPVEFGHCHYEKGDDGRVVCLLTSPPRTRLA